LKEPKIGSAHLSPPVLAETKQHEARARGFAQCVHALQGTLRVTPAGWALVAWLAHGRVPAQDILLWIGIFALGWGVNLLVLRSIVHAGANLALHRPRLLAVALIDGASWGLMVLLLMTHDRFLDSWLVVVLCGAVSVNVPTYITYPPAFRVLVAALWLTILLSSALILSHMYAPRQLLSGLLVYFGILAYTVRIISVRVIEGIQLQLENAALAEQLRETLKQVEHQATTDALTGQMNRRALDAMLRRYMDAANHREFQFSVLMLDVDHFKKINDTHGHHVGDQALRGVADRIAAQLRGGDSCARYGGEEFVIVLPDTLLARALDIAERIRGGLANIPLPTDPALTATASIGAAEYVAGTSIETLLAAADSAVYVAKRNGRNQVCAGEAATSLGGVGSAH